MGLKILTPELLQTVPTLLEQGKSIEEIAAQFGAKVSTLRVQCCKHGVSVRKGGRKNRRLAVPAALYHIQVNEEVILTKDAYNNMRHAASRRGISFSRLAGRLLEIVAKDNLFDSVLDDRDPSTGDLTTYTGPHPAGEMHK